MAADQIANLVSKSNSNVTLLGAYLFPYCEILMDAKLQLLKPSACRLILHPAGSDIWCIGSQMPSRVKWLLDNPYVNDVITYSTSFADEIAEYFNINRKILVFPPVPDADLFFPIPIEMRLYIRNLLTIQEDVFVINHHSNMRRVKCPEVVIEISRKVASNLSRQVVLIMTGEIPLKLLKQLKLPINKCEHSYFKFVSVLPNLIIYWVGLTQNVEDLIKIADIELNCSLHDSFNISLSEAMACGIPIVSSDIVGISPHVIKAECGYLFQTKRLSFNELNHVINNESFLYKYFDIEGAVQKILILANDRLKSTKMGMNGRNYVIKHFSFREIENFLMKNDHA